MKNCNMILTEKQQKHWHYHLTGEKKLPSNQRRIIEQAKFAYSSLGKASERQIKTLEEQGRKTNNSNRKHSGKTFFRRRSKINCFFVFKIVLNE